MHFAGSYHISEYQLTLNTEFYVFIFQYRFPELMTNQCIYFSDRYFPVKHGCRRNNGEMQYIFLNTLSRNFPQKKEKERGSFAYFFLQVPVSLLRFHSNIIYLFLKIQNVALKGELQNISFLLQWDMINYWQQPRISILRRFYLLWLLLDL